MEQGHHGCGWSWAKAALTGLLVSCLPVAPSAIAAWAGAVLLSDGARAHDSSIDTQPGLSMAARQAGGTAWSLGPMQAHSGVFHVIFGDAPSGPGVPPVFGYVLVDDQGQA